MSTTIMYQRSRRFQETGKSIIGDSSPPQNDNYRQSSNHRTNQKMYQEGGSVNQRQRTDFSLDLQSKLKTVTNSYDTTNGYKSQNGGRNYSNTSRNNQNMSYDNQQGSLFPPIAPTSRTSMDKYHQKPNRLTTNESNPLKTECEQYQNLMPCQKQQHRNECQVCKSPSPNRTQPGAAAKNYKEKILQEEQQIFQQLEQIRSKMNNTQGVKKLATPIYSEKVRYKEGTRIPQPLKLASLEQQSTTLNLQQQPSSRRDYQNSQYSETPVQDQQYQTTRANSNFEWGMKGFSQASSPNRILQSLNTIPGSPIGNSNHNRQSSLIQGQKDNIPYSKTVYNTQKNGLNLNDSQTNLGYNIHSKTTYQPKNYQHNKVIEFDNNPETITSIDNLKGTLKKRRPSIQNNNASLKTSLQDTQKNKFPISSKSYSNLKNYTKEPNETGIDVQKIKSSRLNCINILDNLKKLVSNKQNLSYTTQDFFKPQ